MTNHKANSVTLLLALSMMGCSQSSVVLQAPAGTSIDDDGLLTATQPKPKLEVGSSLIKPMSTINNGDYARKELREPVGVQPELLNIPLPTSTAGLNPNIDDLTKNNVNSKMIAYPVKPTTQYINLVDFVSALAPDGWRIIEDAKVSNKRTPVIKSKNWETAIGTLSLIHPDILINKDNINKVIRITPNPNIQSLNRFERTWQIDKSLTLRENIEKWSSESDWEVIWKAGDINFVIDANAKFKGNFSGKHGVLEKLLRGTHTRKTPIMPQWKNGNKVVLIVPKLATYYK